MSNQLIKSGAFKDIVQSDGVKNRLKEIMGERGPQFAAALVQIVNGSYQLQKCQPMSIIGAALQAASLDLSCDPNLGEAGLVPYGDKCTLQIMYRGFIQLAMRSGQYKTIGSKVIYEGELVSYDQLTGELVLNPPTGEENAATVIGYAAKFKLINGFERAEYWTKAAVLAHAERYSKSYRFAKGKPDKEKECVWFNNFDKMGLKTVEKSLLSHYGPKSIQMQKALKVDGGAVLNPDTDELAYPDNDQFAEPVFDKPAEATVEVSASPEPEPQEQPKAAPAKSKTAPVKPEPTKSALNKPKAILGLLEAAELTEGDLLMYLKQMQAVDKTVMSLAACPPDVIDLVFEEHADIIAKMKAL